MGSRNLFPIPLLRLRVSLRKSRNLEGILPDLIIIVAEVMVGEHLEAGGGNHHQDDKQQKCVQNIGNLVMISNLLNAIDVEKLVILLVMVTLLGKILMKRKINKLQIKENHLNLLTI